MLHLQELQFPYSFQRQPHVEWVTAINTLQEWLLKRQFDPRISLHLHCGYKPQWKRQIKNRLPVTSQSEKCVSDSLLSIMIYSWTLHSFLGLHIILLAPMSHFCMIGLLQLTSVLHFLFSSSANTCFRIPSILPRQAFQYLEIILHHFHR